MDGLSNQMMSSSSRQSRYKNLLASRNVPLLFVIVCFVIVANTSCDHVAGTNAETLPPNYKGPRGKREVDGKASESGPNKSINDPLSFLREIYLDNNSKITTLFTAPPAEQSVQKFHPNGRYGRRSVNNYAEPHVELGRLRMADDRGKSPLRSLMRQNSVDYKLQTDNQPGALESSEQIWSSQLDNSNDKYPLALDTNLELNKLLKCNFTGISNLYWCES